MPSLASRPPGDGRDLTPTLPAGDALRWVLGQRLVLRSRLQVLLVSLCSAPLLALCFPPYDLWPLAWVAVTPWAIAVCGAASQRDAVLAGTISMLLAFGWLMNWLLYVPPGWIAAVLLQVFHLALAAIALRWLYKRSAAPLAVLLPLIWVGAEASRGWGPFGFQWFQLAHAFHGQLWAVQCCDLAGTATLSLAAAMVNGLLADLVLQPVFSRVQGGRARLPRRVAVGAVSCGVAWLFVALYGAWRLAEAPACLRPGPRVAVLQPDFPLHLDGRLTLPYSEQLREMLELTKRAARHDPKPDLIAWPEATLLPPYVVNPEFLDALADDRLGRALLRPQSVAAVIKRDGPGGPAAQAQAWQAQARDMRDRLERLSRQLDVCLLLGSTAIEPQPPEADRAVRRFNGATLVTPRGGVQRLRHDKIHIVPLGEYVPFRDTALHGVYRLINDHLHPFGMGGYDFSLDAGEFRAPMELPSPASAPAGQASARFAATICFESTVASVGRAWGAGGPGRAPADFIVNISNDGWFGRDEELLQHLSLNVFRAVETRVGVARAVNTGVSAFIDPTGRVYGHVVNAQGQAWTGLCLPELPALQELASLREEAPDSPRVAQLRQQASAARAAAGVSGYSVQQVWLDSRETLYARWGDWLAWPLSAALWLTGLAALATWLWRWGRRGSPAAAQGARPVASALS